VLWQVCVVLGDVVVWVDPWMEHLDADVAIVNVRADVALYE